MAERVRVEIDYRRIERRLAAATNKAQAALDWQVLSDCDPYVPFDTGNLAGSAWRELRPGSGEIVWEGPYAAKQYYECPNKAHDAHPLATMAWFEHSKAANLDKWMRVKARAAAQGWG